VAAGLTPLPGRAAGSGPVLLVDAAQNNAFRAVNEAWKAGGTVHVDATRGRYAISGVPAGTLDRFVSSLALRAERSTAAPGTRLPRPRLGLYRPWTASMDEGWTRWLLEQYGFEFVNLYNADVRAGDLRSRLDVIVIADERPRSIMEGFQTGSVPPQYAGGIGAEGARALDAFVQDGGTLVCFNNSTLFAIDALHLPVKNVVADLRRNQFFSSGSILEVRVEQGHPIMAGVRERAKIFVNQSPVFAPLDGFDGTVLATYPPSGSPLLSGYLLGEQHLQGQAAALDVRHGRGHVVLLGFRPQWRGQPFGTFKILFNAALYHGEHTGRAPTREPSTTSR